MTECALSHSLIHIIMDIDSLKSVGNSISELGNLAKQAGGKLLLGPLNSFLGKGLNLDKVAGGLFDSLTSPNTWDALFNNWSQAHMTGAQKEQNEWTAMREDSYWQRNVEGMQEAGLNPALLYGGSASGPNPSASATPASGMSLSDLLELSAIKPQIELVNAQADAARADAAMKRSNASLNEQLRMFNERVNPLRERAAELQNNLTAANERKIYEQLGEIRAHIDKLVKEAATEEERKNLVVSQKLAEDAKAYQIYALVPYQIELSKARSSADRAAAALSAVNAAYQNKLLNSGYLDNMFSEMSAKARSAEARAKMDEIKASIRNGTFGVQELGDNVIADTVEAIASFGSSTLAGFVNFVDNLNPFASAFK